VQLGISALYSSLQRWQRPICTSPRCKEVLVAVAQACLAALSGECVLREPAVSAAASLWAAAMLPNAHAPQLAMLFVRGLLRDRQGAVQLAMLTDDSKKPGSSASFVAEAPLREVAVALYAIVVTRAGILHMRCTSLEIIPGYHPW
jgi:hypothetical protein